MMRRLELFLYRLIVRIHPAAFRKEFGREMLLDFEESLTHEGTVRIFLDALLSVARQWTRCAVSGGADRTCEAQPSLLAGQYAPVRDQPLNALELGRGFLASLVLLALCGYSLSHGASRIRSFDIVYAASRGGRVPEGGAAGQTSGSSSASSAAGRRFTEFDVASVRENRTGKMYTSFPLTMGNDYYVPTHGYMKMIGLPLSAYIQFAYDMNPNEVVALRNQLPDWANSARYDIEARVAGNPNKADMRRMLRALLADHFKLLLRREEHTDKVYDLVLAKPGRTGPGLHEHPADDPACQQHRPQGLFNPCGTVAYEPDLNTNSLRMTGRDVSIAQFILSASSKVDRTIIDKTGLSGKYDFTLEFVPPKIGGGPDPNASEPPPGPTFTDAMQDQMGLKLVPDKGTVTTYVLDHLDKPTEN